MKTKLILTLFTFSIFALFYSCKKETKNIDNEKNESLKDSESKRSNGNFIKTINLSTYTSLSNEVRMGLVLFLNERGIENKVDSLDILITQKGNIQKINAILMGEEGLTSYIFGNALLSPKIDSKEAFNVEINFYNNASKKLLGNKLIVMKIGTKSFNSEDEVFSEKFLPGTYPVCLMFDSAKIGGKMTYNFTFIGLVVEADSTIKYIDALENAKNKKMMMTFGRKNKIPANYLTGKGFYPDMKIMMYGINDLGPQFYKAINSVQNVEYVLENNYDYWNVTRSQSSNFTNKQKIINGGGRQEEKLKNEWQKQIFKK